MPVLLAGNLLYACAIIAASVTMRSLRQVLVPRDVLGRVTASWRLGGQSVTLIGGVLAGAGAGLLGGDPRPVFAVAGTLTLLTVTAAWLTGIRRESVAGAAFLRPHGSPRLPRGNPHRGQPGWRSKPICVSASTNPTER